jgi:hypothetical protein
LFIARTTPYLWILKWLFANGITCSYHVRWSRVPEYRLRRRSGCISSTIDCSGYTYRCAKDRDVLLLYGCRIGQPTLWTSMGERSNWWNVLWRKAGDRYIAWQILFGKVEAFRYLVSFTQKQSRLRVVFTELV